MEHKPIAIMILLVYVMGTLMVGILAATGNAQESFIPESNDTVRTEEGSNEPVCINEEGQMHPCLSPQDGTAAQASNTPSPQESSNTESAGTTQAVSGPDAKTILDIHNQERAAVGVPDLVWSDSLAADAAAYLEQMVKANQGRVWGAGLLRHDPNIPSTQGENLARAADAHSNAAKLQAPSVGQLVNQWVAEKPYRGALD